MLLWFVVLAPVIVAEVFRSPMADYRLVALGAVLPLAEVVLGGPRLLHTLAGAVAALAVVMAVTTNRRLLRRRWLGIPIGLLLHLVLSATWTVDRLLWWPGFGFGFPDGGLPEWSRPWWIGLGLELAAGVVAVWAYRRYELDEPDNRALLWREGRLSRSVVA